jgi:hypothetical protein
VERGVNSGADARRLLSQRHGYILGSIGRHFRSACICCNFTGTCYKLDEYIHQSRQKS